SRVACASVPARTIAAKPNLYLGRELLRTRTGRALRVMRTTARVAAFMLLSTLTIAVARADDDSVANEYRLILSPYHRITDKLTGFGTFAYYWNPDREYHTYQFAYPGLSYSLNRALQLSGGLDSRYTYNEESADKLELRPF